MSNRRLRGLDGPELDAFLATPRLAHVGVVLPDGRPHTSSVIYGWDGVCLEFSTRRERRKFDGLAPGARISVSIAEDTPPWRGVTINGVIEHASDDEESARAILTPYMGVEAAAMYAAFMVAREPDRVRIRVRPRSIASWNLSKAFAKIARAMGAEES